MQNYEVYCTNVDDSTSDSELIEYLKNLTRKTSSCIDGFKLYSYYHGIVKLDETQSNQLYIFYLIL